MRKRSSQITPTLWHSLNIEEIFKRLDSQELGLSQAEAARRLTTTGLNKLSASTGRNPLQRLLSQFHNVLVYLLLIAAIVTYFTGERIDSIVILAVIIINAIIGFTQEGKAEKALASIRNLLTLQARVIRDGNKSAIAAEQLVPGDIVLLESGDKVPADLRLFQVKNLRIDESLLTGESVSVTKHDQIAPSDAILSDRLNMAYSGTFVTYGTGTGVVVATADATELGKINKLLATVPALVTPLLRQIAGFSRWLSAMIVVIAIITFAFGWYGRHMPINDLFMAMVSLSVAAIPEGLPAIITITLAIGVQQMAKRNAIVRRLPAIETLGSVTVICTDKTGTLTCNEMTVKSVATGKQLFSVDGAGYDPNLGKIRMDGNTITLHDYPDLLQLINACILCNNAAIVQQKQGWVNQGDPTEAALITLAMKAGINPETLKQELPRLDLIPFESDYALMATLHEHHKYHFVFVKGAPEQILARCQYQSVDGLEIPLDKEAWKLCIQELASMGQRVLAIARKQYPSSCQQLNFSDIATDLVMLGIVGMIDPPRPESAQAVQRCQQAGILVKMVTGDHVSTAQAIAENMKIGNGNALSGIDIDRLTDKELQKVAVSTDVFARVSPEHKLRLVRALQAKQQIVGMTGDGVNDAPALKSADIGIAMGKKGTEVAKEVSEIVLTDDNFDTIAKAVEAGRGVYDNLTKAIIYILPTSIAEAMIIVVATMTGNILPITPIQVLWINMITETTLSLTLAFESPESNIMTRPPRKADAPLLSGFLIWRILFVSAIMVCGTYALFLWEQTQSPSIPAARTVAVNTLVMFEIFYIFNSRYLLNSVLSIKGLFGNGLIWLAILVLGIMQAALTYYPPMQAIFGTEPLALHDWQNICLVAVSVFILVEIEKFMIATARIYRQKA